MDDLISRQEAIEALEREKTYCTAFREGYTQTNVFEKYNAGLSDGIKALKNLPSAQPEIIRCKECKHWLDIDDGRQKHRMCADIYGDWFCADAERRTDE